MTLFFYDINEYFSEHTSEIYDMIALFHSNSHDKVNYLRKFWRFLIVKIQIFHRQVNKKKLEVIFEEFYNLYKIYKLYLLKYLYKIL